MKNRIEAATLRNDTIVVVNEAYPRDLFTDRWPENVAAQRTYSQDLRITLATLYRLRNEALSPERIKNELERLFGESVATYAVEKFLDERRNEASKGSLKFGTGGRILTGAAATSVVTHTARRDLWPDFRTRSLGPYQGVWEGRITPYNRSYLARVTYTTPIMAEMFTVGRVQPRVRILSPVLEQHHDYEEGPIPHVYWDDPKHPALCLFSPEGREWGVDDLIAETTIFWTARWLGFYEGWLVTKKWRGGGRHPGKDIKQLATV
jgi:hypothetical protein